MDPNTVRPESIAAQALGWIDDKTRAITPPIHVSSTYLRDYLGLIRDTIAAGQQSGAFRPDVNATMAAKMFFGALDEMATNWMLSRRKYDLAGDADAVVDLIIGGLGR